MNWRKDPVTASTYYDAMQRHMLAWQDGEDHAADSGLLHLAHVMANCAILIDAAACGTLIDDRTDDGMNAASHVIAYLTHKDDEPGPLDLLDPEEALTFGPLTPVEEEAPERPIMRGQPFKTPVSQLVTVKAERKPPFDKLDTDVEEWDYDPRSPAVREEPLGHKDWYEEKLAKEAEGDAAREAYATMTRAGV